MRNKAFSPLVELIFMIAIFSIVAAVCVSGFSLSHQISRRTQQTDAAVILAQNLAEQMKGCQISVASTPLTFRYNDQLQPTEADTPAYTVTVTPIATDYSQLQGAQICVSSADEILFSLTIHWQKEA